MFSSATSTGFLTIPASRWFYLYPGWPVPMIYQPFSEKIPHIQPKPSMVQLEAISTYPIPCSLGEETDPTSPQPHSRELWSVMRPPHARCDAPIVFEVLPCFHCVAPQDHEGVLEWLVGWKCSYHPRKIQRLTEHCFGLWRSFTFLLVFFFKPLIRISSLQQLQADASSKHAGIYPFFKAPVLGSGEGRLLQFLNHHGIQSCLHT